MWMSRMPTSGGGGGPCVVKEEACKKARSNGEDMCRTRNQATTLGVHDPTIQKWKG
jgi:hypothetical protein